MKRVLPILLLLGALTAARAQEAMVPTGGIINLGRFYSGLIDPSRITMRQSLTMSYSSLGRTGLFSNLYSNRINYRLSEKLELDLNLAVRYTPQQLNNRSLFQQGRMKESLFLPSFGLKFRPVSGMLLEIQYQQGDPWGGHRYWGW